jgi:hypothetical protein
MAGELAPVFAVYALAISVQLDDHPHAAARV